MVKTMKCPASKYWNERRKDANAAPCIDLPLALAEVLWRAGDVREPSNVVVPLRHSTLEDMERSPDMDCLQP